MTCPHEPQVDDYVDGTLPSPVAAAFAAHLEACRSCAALVDDLRALRTATADLEQRPVPPYLWTRIEARRREDVAAVPAAGLGRLFAGFRSVAWLPAAAAVCVLVIAAVLWTLRAPVPGPPPQPVNEAATASGDPVGADLEVGQQHYETAIADLQKIASADRAALDPQTSAVLDTNLSVIDKAIDESRAALDDQPASEAARDSLFEALRSKVVLLQDTVTLINEMRKGDQDGVARAISGLNQ